MGYEFYYKLVLSALDADEDDNIIRVPVLEEDLPRLLIALSNLGEIQSEDHTDEATVIYGYFETLNLEPLEYWFDEYEVKFEITT